MLRHVDNSVEVTLPAMCRLSSGAAVAVIRKHVHMVGGDDNDTSLERLLPTGNWQELPHMNEARRYFAAAVIADRL